LIEALEFKYTPSAESEHPKELSLIFAFGLLSGRNPFDGFQYHKNIYVKIG
jgi:hypothetical protein